MTQPGQEVPDLYQLLAVSPNASAADIVRAYRRKARAVHPDSRPDDAGAADQFRALTSAYQVLSNPGQRAVYDRRLRSQPKPPSPAPSHTRSGPWPTAGLRAGPVHFEPARSPAPGRRAAADPELQPLAYLLLHHLSGRSFWSWPW